MTASAESGAPGPGPWVARLSRKAEEALRGLPPVCRVTVAGLLDVLERDGPAAGEPAARASGGSDGARGLLVHELRQGDVAEVGRYQLAGVLVAEAEKWHCGCMGVGCETSQVRVGSKWAV